MSKYTTISDVAEALGVSKTTISRAISGKGRIGKETKERVLSYIEEHDYKPNVIAKGLAQSKTYNLCVVMPGEYNVKDLTFFQECMYGIQEVAGSMEYDLLVSICGTNDISSLERIVSNHKVDGVILMRTFVKDIQIEFLLQKKIPFVTIGSTAYEGVIKADHNHKNACAELTMQLLQKSIRKIAMLGGNMEFVVNQLRFAGFLQAYEQLGLTADEELIFLNLEQYPDMDAAVKQSLEKNAECILCMDDGICSRVLKYLQENRIQIPGGMKVASFYNSHVLENNIPAITALNFDERELGGAACHLLLDMINEVEVKEEILLPYEVLLRESV